MTRRYGTGHPGRCQGRRRGGSYLRSRNYRSVNRNWSPPYYHTFPVPPDYPVNQPFPGPLEYRTDQSRDKFQENLTDKTFPVPPNDLANQPSPISPDERESQPFQVPPENTSKEQELEILEKQASLIREKLKFIQKRVKKLSGRTRSEPNLKVFVDANVCTGCGACFDVCSQGAITINDIAEIDKSKCTGCRACVDACPQNALSLRQVIAD